ncbi:MAG: polysaccharide deacetylase family protein [Oscillospiraceae bacterium]|nr:polysaccharide deacetylase family protein [Oscillospiraceae bacterium]MCL2213540.1 polysaccharide deacetylase family protein [Oscillospiraceae bacterium]
MKKLLLGIMATVICLQSPAVLRVQGNETSPVYYNDEIERIFAYRADDDQDGDKKIALTFDDGPHPRYTDEILDILKEHDIPATFYVLGENAEKYPDVLRRIAKEGHELGNHTYNHNISGKSGKHIAEQLRKTADFIHETTGKRPATFRPPGGLINKAVKAAAKEMDYPIILWRIDPRDWRNPPAARMFDHVSGEVKSGDVILFHDFNVANSQTPEAVRRLVPLLLEQKYEFVTVSELFGF